MHGASNPRLGYDDGGIPSSVGGPALVIRVNASGSLQALAKQHIIKPVFDVAEKIMLAGPKPAPSESCRDAEQDGEKTLRIQLPKQQFIPPLSFTMVSDGIYRSGHPLEVNLPFLDRIRLKSIIHLNPWVPYPEFLMTYLAVKGITLLPLATSAPPSNTHIGAVLAHLTAKNTLPCLLISKKGKHAVSVMVAAYRRCVQGWAEEGWAEEYRRVCGADERAEADLAVVRGLRPGHGVLEEVEWEEGFVGEGEGEEAGWIEEAGI